MTKRTIFISFDGKEFATEKACCEYEILFNDILPALKKINKICESQRTCKNCKFVYGDEFCLLKEGVPEDWDLKTLQERLGD